jgi:exodeoxyribonuclease V alpha subunit
LSGELPALEHEALDPVLTGTLQRVVYAQPERGFMIARFLLEDGDTLVTVKGTLFQVGEHETLRLKGHWEDHRVYGPQFVVEEFMPVQPSTLEGITRFLSSGLFKGIGEATARKIVEKFGTDTFEIIDRSPESLLRVKGVNKTQYKSLREGWSEQREVREVLTFLHGLGVTPAYAQKIYGQYGMSSIAILQANPYQITEISGIGFLTADAIARKLGFDENSPERAQAGLLHMLEQQSLSGHTCFPRAELVAQLEREFHIAPEVSEPAFDPLKTTRQIVEIEGDPPLVARNRLYQAERRIAENLLRILHGEALTSIPESLQWIREQELLLELTLDSAQQEAVEAALQHKVLIITGGPGTGKTTIVRFILALMRSRVPNLALAAPTGRAAKRMTEATGAPASTIHRLLEANNLGFQRNQEVPLEQELLIIDESSMIDTPLMDALLQAVPPTSRLLLVGDVDQLPSVGPGSVLRDCIESNLIPVARLERIFRQAQDSRITVNAHSVRRGILPELERVDSGSELRDFYFIREPDPEQVTAKITALVSERIPQRFGLDPMQDIQVLTPMHRGSIGSVRLNEVLQQTLNPEGPSLEHRDRILRIGDKVMQQQNDYDKEVFNGDLGRVLEVDADTRTLHVEFDQGVVTYESKDLDQLLLAYAISVHKSQGSEYPAVVLPLTMQHYVMLQRNLLYTALTRGKQLVILIGTEQAVRQAVESEQTLVRHTLLPQHLQTTFQRIVAVAGV